MKKKILIVSLLFSLISNVFFVHLPSASTLEEIILSQLGSSNISVSLRSMEEGNVIYEKNGDVGIKPASTLKLLTATTALHELGENYRFTTKLFITGEIQNSVLHGDIYIQGGGDPTLQEDNFDTFAFVLKRAGIESIAGNIYGDDTEFVGPQLTPGIAKHDESYYYAARTSALTMSPDDDYDAGTLIVNVKANSLGKSPIISVEPDLSGMKLINQAKTVPSNEKNTINIYRQHNTNKIFIIGNLPQGSSIKEWVTLVDPTINTLYAVKSILKQNGISTSKYSTVERKIVPSDAKLIYTKKSIPLKKLMVPFLKLSNNSFADILVKTMGKQVYGVGSLEHGLLVMNGYGQQLGLEMDHWMFEDGSGMSHKNKVTANQLTELLFTVRDKPYYGVFFNSLPIGGQPDRLIGGSLRERFNTNILKNRVVAKTGHISGVYTLSGYIKANSGKQYAFSIMTQNQTSIKLKSIDEIVKAMIEKY
nr:D-alanyl-D-alanine carboxypeptidase/D-alanyl-D-alanine-endopeptidase [Lysinibacillus timonensis]